MRIVAYIAFGIILPALALLIEATGAPLASEVFDPIPTTGHMALVALVVLANLLAPMGHPTCDPRLRHLIAWLNGVALVYALVFLPLALPGVMLIPFMGIGFLVLSPMFALVCAAAVRVWLQQQAPAGQRLPWLWPWVAVGALLLVALELPGTLTRLGIETATTGSPAASARAVGLLRDWAPRQEMLRLCYENGRQMNVTWWMCPARPLPIAVARSVLFRVTGKPLSAFGSPRRNTRFPWASVNGDTNQGGTEVGQRVAGLALIASHMEGMHHGDAGMGYLEWTLEFENASAAQAEAWAEVDLPPGAVVSRLTLWIDDRPKEATFAGSAKVRAAYEAVVRQQRDPVLVTASGPDRVLVQCFPVPPNGGTIHVRLGITAPLDINQPGKAALRLPRFAERNFDIPEGDIHNLNIGGKSVIASVDGLKPITDGQQSNAVVGRVSDMALASPVGVRLTSAGPARRVWAATGPGQAVVQTVDREKVAPIRRLVVVADGSVGMRNHLADIAEAIDRVSSEVDIQVLFAGDQVDESVEALRAGRAVGGRDNVPALL